MVIVLMGAPGSGATTLGSALASRIGWPFVDAHSHGVEVRGSSYSDHGHEAALADARDRVQRALDRREPLVVACPPLTGAERSHLAGERTPVRFVSLGNGVPGPEASLALDGTAELEEQLARVREQFGL